MWNSEDFQGAVHFVAVATYKEEIEWVRDMLSQICKGNDRHKLWSMLTDLQKDILKHPEYLPSENEIENGV
jgi:uncharacterized protein YpbB